MGLSSIISRIVPVAIGVATGGPIGGYTAAVATEATKRQEKRIARENERIKQENERIMEYFGTTGRSTFNDPYSSSLNVNAGATSSSGGFFDTLRGGLRETGGFLNDLFYSGIPSLLGYNRPPNVGQQPAITTVTNLGAAETSGSGTIEAGFGSVVPTLVNAGRNLLKNPFGQIGLGTAVGGAVSLMTPDGRRVRITRKMKSQAKMVLNMTGGNLAAASEILGIDQNTLVMILLKRFRNDGPVVTKAALRKTKQTVRRLKNMCDMYDSLRPSPTRRKAPVRRASTTLISNK
jgi:hypothetical protein